MRAKLFLLAIGGFLCAAPAVPARAFQYYSSATLTGVVGRGNDLAVASSGDIYIVGNIYEEFAGGQNIWVARYNSALVWQSSHCVNGTAGNTDDGGGIAIDGSGNVYATGAVRNGSRELWLAKFDSQLALQSSRTVSGVGMGYEAVTDQAGNVYVIAGELGLPAWVGKFSPALVLLASATFNGAGAGGITDGANNAAALAIDASDKIYAAASLNANVRVVTYDTSLSPLASINYKVLNYNLAMQDIAVAPGGDVYVAGATTHDDQNIWIGRFDSGLNFLGGITPINGSNNSFDWATSIAADARGVYATGYLGEAVTGADMWIASYAPDLVLRSSMTFAGAFTGERGYGVRLNGDGDVFVTGVLAGPNPGVVRYFSPAAGSFGGTALGHSSITWTWDAAPYAAGYRVYSDGGSPVSPALSSATLSWTETGLSPNTLYRRFVRADNGIVDDSAAASVRTALLPPPVVTGASPALGSNFDSAFRMTVTGDGFQEGAGVRLVRWGGDSILTAGQVTVQSATSAVCVISLLGALPGSWNVVVVNPDGQDSGTVVNGIFTVAQGQSEPHRMCREVASGAGAVVETPNDGTRLTIPENAMGSGLVYVSEDPTEHPLVVDPSHIRAADGALPGNYSRLGGLSREFVAFEGGRRRTENFSRPVELEIAYPDEDGDGAVDGTSFNAARCRLMTLNETTRQWVEVPGAQVDTRNRRVRAQLEHFSVYALFGFAPAADLVSLKAYPTPWKPGSGGAFDAAGITFTNLTDVAAVRVYTLRGDLVRELAVTPSDGGAVVWDGRNADGAKVASGVYLAVVKTSGETKILKVAVER